MVLGLLVDLSLREISCSLKALSHAIRDEKFQALAIAISLDLNNNFKRYDLSFRCRTTGGRTLNHCQST